MDVSLLVKVAGIGILVAVAHQVLSKSGRDEMAMLVSLAGIIIVLMMLVEQITRLFNTIRGAFGL